MKIAILLSGLYMAFTVAAYADSNFPNVTLALVSDKILRITYSTVTPVKRLALNRVPDDQRLARWQSTQNGLHLIHKDDVDYIERKDGLNFTQAIFDVPMTYTVLPKEYAPFMPYSDGGVLIHTGRFQSCVYTCGDDHPSFGFPMAIKVPPSAHLILDGNITDKNTSWVDMQDGTMIYVGTETPIETENVIALIDPAIPSIIKDALKDKFPKMMDYYADKLGPLVQKPALFAALDRYSKADGNPDSNNFSRQGGTLPGQVFMHLAGDGWFEDPDIWGEQIANSLPWFFAHEAGHMYQRGANYTSSEQDAWINEGGADAFAVLALKELEVSPDNYISGRIEGAIDQCLSGLNEGDLRSAASRGAFRLYYNCGMIIQLAAHRAIQAQNSDNNLYSLWSNFLNAVRGGKPWSEKTFLMIMTDLAGKEVSNFAELIITGDPAITKERILAALGR